MKAVIPIFLIAIAAAVAAFLVLDPLHDRAAAYKSANERILAQLKHPPVAELVSSKQDPYEEEGVSSLLNRAKGWTLSQVYKVPDVVKSDDVTAFYQQNPPAGWQAEVIEVPGGVNSVSGQPLPSHRNLRFSSGDQRIDINLDNMYEGGPHTYEVAIDHKGALKP